MNDYQIKLEKIPKNIRAIYSAIKGVDINIKLGEEYKFSPEQRDAYLDIVADIFFKEMNLSFLLGRLKTELGLDEETAKKLANDIVGYRLLPADFWFDGEAKKYLIANGADSDFYDKAMVDYLAAVATEAKEYEAEMAEEAPFEMPPVKEEPLPVFDPIREKQDAESLFKESLVSTLSIEEQDFLSQFNTTLLKLIVDDSAFKKSIEQELYKNQEILTSNSLMIEGEQEKGTVENWLKNFIAQNGSDSFSNIVLAKYLTASDGAKSLSPAERNLVKKLLKLYRNLVFFPDSMKDIPLEDWELFPIDRDHVEEVIHPEKLNTPNAMPVMEATKETPEEDLGEAIKEVVSTTVSEVPEISVVSVPAAPVGNIVPPAEFDEATEAAKKILEELENGNKKIMPKEESPEIKSLRALAEKYEVGSLERRAIEAEIKKKIQ